MAHHRALGAAGGAAGIENDQPVLGHRDRGGFSGVSGDQHGFIRVTEFDDVRRPRCEFVESPRVARRHDCRLGRRERRAMLEFAGRQPPIERRDNRPQFRAGEFELDILDPIFGQNGNPIAPAHAPGRQRVRQPVHPRIEGSIGQAQPLIIDRDRLRPNPRLLRQQAPDGASPRRRCYRRTIHRLVVSGRGPGAKSTRPIPAAL